MNGFCFTKNLVNTEKSCTEFKKLDCNSNFTEQCHKLGYEAIRANLAGSVCPDTITTRLGIGNRISYFQGTNKKVRYFENLSAIFIYITLICTFTYMVLYLYKQLAKYDNAVLTPSDYTVKLCGLPCKGSPITKEEGMLLREHLKTKIELLGFEVVGITFTYNLDDYLSLRNQFC